MYQHIDIVVGGQFGSESKGRVSAERVAYHCRTQRHLPAPANVYSVRVGGPNAGHVVVDSEGREFKMQQIPVGFLEPEAQLHIAAGSEVDMPTLTREVQMLEAAGHQVRGRLTVDPQATILTQEHRDEEVQSDLNARTGSTAHGIGAARAARIWRKAPIVRDYTEQIEALGARVDNPLADHTRTAPVVVIEGTQGYGLGLHAGYYPQCTSNDARAIDFAAMAGVNPWDVVSRNHFQVHMVVRPYPIRVAGNSGPLTSETSWDELGLPSEQTTVTNKTRRVGLFNESIVRLAVDANGRGVTRIHLGMADQVDRDLANIHGVVSLEQLLNRTSHLQINDELRDLVIQINRIAPVVSLGTGPRTQLVVSDSDQ